MDIVFFLLRWGSSCIILCNIGTNLICIYISWKIGLHFLLCGEIWLLFVGSKIDALIPGIIKIVTRVLGLHFELWLWFVINGNPLKLRLQKKRLKLIFKTRIPLHIIYLCLINQELKSKPPNSFYRKENFYLQKSFFHSLVIFPSRIYFSYFILLFFSIYPPSDILTNYSKIVEREIHGVCFRATVKHKKNVTKKTFFKHWVSKQDIEFFKSTLYLIIPLLVSTPT